MFFRDFFFFCPRRFPPSVCRKTFLLSVDTPSPLRTQRAHRRLQVPAAARRGRDPEDDGVVDTSALRLRRRAPSGKLVHGIWNVYYSSTTGRMRYRTRRHGPQSIKGRFLYALS